MLSKLALAVPAPNDSLPRPAESAKSGAIWYAEKKTAAEKPRKSTRTLLFAALKTWYASGRNRTRLKRSWPTISRKAPHFVVCRLSRATSPSTKSSNSESSSKQAPSTRAPYCGNPKATAPTQPKKIQLMVIKFGDTPRRASGRLKNIEMERYLRKAQLSPDGWAKCRISVILP